MTTLIFWYKTSSYKQTFDQVNMIKTLKSLKETAEFVYEINFHYILPKEFALMYKDINGKKMIINDEKDYKKFYDNELSKSTNAIEIYAVPKEEVYHLINFKKLLNSDSFNSAMGESDKIRFKGAELLLAGNNDDLNNLIAMNNGNRIRDASQNNNNEDKKISESEFDLYNRVNEFQGSSLNEFDPISKFDMDKESKKFNPEDPVFLNSKYEELRNINMCNSVFSPPPNLAPGLMQPQKQKANETLQNRPSFGINGTLQRNDGFTANNYPEQTGQNNLPIFYTKNDSDNSLPTPRLDNFSYGNIPLDSPQNTQDYSAKFLTESTIYTDFTAKDIITIYKKVDISNNGKKKWPIGSFLKSFGNNSIPELIPIESIAPGLTSSVVIILKYPKNSQDFNIMEWKVCYNDSRGLLKHMSESRHLKLEFPMNNYIYQQKFKVIEGLDTNQGRNWTKKPTIKVIEEDKKLYSFGMIRNANVLKVLFPGKDLQELLDFAESHAGLSENEIANAYF